MSDAEWDDTEETREAELMAEYKNECALYGGEATGAGFDNWFRRLTTPPTKKVQHNDGLWYPIEE